MSFYSVSANKAHVQNLANSKRKNTTHCKYQEENSEALRGTGFESCTETRRLERHRRHPAKAVRKPFIPISASAAQ